MKCSSLPATSHKKIAAMYQSCIFFLLYSQRDNENSWQTKAKPQRSTLLCGLSLTPKTMIKSWRTVHALSTNHIAPRKCLLQS